MATIYTHAVVGFGIAQVYSPRRRVWLYWTLSALLPVVPDLDVFSSSAYGSMLGHRGFTHSPVFALWVGFLAASLTFRLLGASFWILGLIFSTVIAPHGLLDAMTRGGVDIPFFWPVADERYGNWGPLLLPDLGFEFPDPRRSRALRSEMLWIWLPTLAWIAAVTMYRVYTGVASQPNESQKT